MDSKHTDSLKKGARVVVPMGAAVAEIYGTPPIVTTGTLIGDADGEFVWVDTDIAQGQTLPQRYRVSEVIGFLMPMAIVTHDDNGTTWGRLPEGYVGP